MHRNTKVRIYIVWSFEKNAGLASQRVTRYNNTGPLSDYVQVRVYIDKTSDVIEEWHFDSTVHSHLLPAIMGRLYDPIYIGETLLTAALYPELGNWYYSTMCVNIYRHGSELRPWFKMMGIRRCASHRLYRRDAGERVIGALICQTDGPGLHNPLGCCWPSSRSEKKTPAVHTSSLSDVIYIFG